MIVKQIYKKKKEPIFQNTNEVEKTEQNQSNKIDDIKLDSEYVDHTNELESKDDESLKSKKDSEEE